MGFVIRPAVAADLGALLTVHHSSIREVCGRHYAAEQLAAWLEPLSPETYADMLAHRHVLVADDGDLIVGLGVADLDAGVLNAVYVAPSHLGGGIGRALVSALESAARAHSVPALVLQSTTNAVGFYVSLGYVDDGPTLNELPSKVSLPCVAMHKELAGHT